MGSILQQEIRIWDLNGLIAKSIDMIANIFTKIPKIGDAVVGELSTGKVKFIEGESFVLSSLDASAYETIGVVYARKGREVKIAFKENANKIWSSKYMYILSGYTLDGESRSGTLSFRESSSASVNTDVVVSYAVTTKSALVARLNEVIAGNASMVSQGWAAFLENDEIKISFNYTFWQQSSYNTAKNGFSMSAALMPDITSFANIRRKHGGVDGEGVIASCVRALDFYRSSTSADTYAGNVPADIASAKERGYPVNLTSYLGKSADGLDHCALLRATFGEGEEGWLNCIEAYLPVKPTDFGNMGIRNGLELTKAIVAHKDENGESFGVAAAYCYEKGTTCLPQGNFYLPTIEDISDLLATIQYGTSISRESDAINRTLYRMGGSSISSRSNLWSCCRTSSYSVWYATSNFGYFSGSGMYNSFVAVPVSLYYIED